MTTFAVTMVRDEADIIEATVRRMARQVDWIIVADNGSVDGTRDILEALAHELPLWIVDDREPGYFQSQKMTALAQRAGAAGADWVVPFDADEVWLPRTGRRIADVLADLPAAVLVAEAPLFDHVATGFDDQALIDPVARIVWRRAAQAPLRKVAVRPRVGLTIHQGNHAASFKSVVHPPAVTSALEVRHFPYRSWEQMARKARNGAQAYAATDLPDEVGGHWRGYGRLLAEHGEQAIRDVFEKWFYRHDPTVSVRIDGEKQGPLVRDPCP